MYSRLRHHPVHVRFCAVMRKRLGASVLERWKLERRLQGNVDYQTVSASPDYVLESPILISPLWERNNAQGSTSVQLTVFYCLVLMHHHKKFRTPLAAKQDQLTASITESVPECFHVSLTISYCCVGIILSIHGLLRSKNPTHAIHTQKRYMVEKDKLPSEEERTCTPFAMQCLLSNERHCHQRPSPLAGFLHDLRHGTS